MGLEAAREEATLTEFSRYYGRHTNPIRTWKELLLSETSGMFASCVEAQRSQHDLVRQLRANIRRLDGTPSPVERDEIGELKREVQLLREERRSYV